MAKIKSLDELKQLRDTLHSMNEARVNPGSPAGIIQVKVAMATCGIASGARPIYDYLSDELAKRNIPARVSQTGCMSYCYAEPTVEVTLPGHEPVTFGFVNIKKADEIIEKYIRKGELPDGVIPVNYETIDQQ